MTTPLQLKRIYEQGVNISQYLRGEQGIENNTEEIIEIAYDLQTGSYIAQMADKSMSAFKDAYAKSLVETILSLCMPESLLEAGVGEATTLSGVLGYLPSLVRSYGFDLSWSRVAFAKKWLARQGLTATTLCTGNLLQIPFADNSIDIVYTSHSIEPNGGKEKPILRELYRVARKFLILLEPGYDLASEAAKQRMASHGYCRNLKQASEELGFDVMRHELFPISANPMNPTALTIIKKNEVEPSSFVLACPACKTYLQTLGGMMFSPEALVVYPIVGGIPCLRAENGIIASKYLEVMDV